MSLVCYDFQKWTILTMLAILTVCLVGMINLVYGQEVNNNTQYCKDLVKNGIDITTDPICGNNVEEQQKQHELCVVYDSPAFIIIDMRCAGLSNSAIAYYVSQGYEIKAATDKTIYLQKETK